MSRLYRAVAILIAAAVMTAVPLNQAAANPGPGGCSAIAFPFPSPTFPDICEIMPHLCKDKGPIVVLGDTVAGVAKAASHTKANAWHSRVAARHVIRRADNMMRALQVNPSVAGPTMNYIRQIAGPRLAAVEAGQLTVGQFTVEIGNLLIGAAEQGSTSYQQASTAAGATVTTTTNAGIEINFGIFKITIGQTVTTVETVPGGSDDSGFSEECDDDGNCTCSEDPQ